MSVSYTNHFTIISVWAETNESVTSHVTRNTIQVEEATVATILKRQCVLRKSNCLPLI